MCSTSPATAELRILTVVAPSAAKLETPCRTGLQESGKKKKPTNASTSACRVPATLARRSKALDPNRQPWDWKVRASGPMSSRTHRARRRKRSSGQGTTTNKAGLHAHKILPGQGDRGGIGIQPGPQISSHEAATVASHDAGGGPQRTVAFDLVRIKENEGKARLDQQWLLPPNAPLSSALTSCSKGGHRASAPSKQANKSPQGTTRTGGQCRCDSAARDAMWQQENTRCRGTRDA